MSDVEELKSYIGTYNVTDIRSLLHPDHEQFSEVTEEISSDASKQKRVRAFDHVNGAPGKASWPHPSDSGQRAKSRIAERAGTALLRAMEDNTRFPVAFILDEEDPTIGLGTSQAACGSDAIGCSQISVGHDRD